jgi:hypothetical protein
MIKKISILLLIVSSTMLSCKSEGDSSQNDLLGFLLLTQLQPTGIKCTDANHVTFDTTPVTLKFSPYDTHPTFKYVAFGTTTMADDTIVLNSTTTDLSSIDTIMVSFPYLGSGCSAYDDSNLDGGSDMLFGTITVNSQTYKFSPTISGDRLFIVLSTTNPTDVTIRRQ